jgi:hypothetical protein
MTVSVEGPPLYIALVIVVVVTGLVAYLSMRQKRRSGSG